MKKEGKARKTLLVALSVLLSLNIILSAMPRIALASSDAISNMNELISAISGAGQGTEVELKIDSDFELHDTIVIDKGARIVLRPAFGNVTIRRSADFGGVLFEVIGAEANGSNLGYSSSLTIGDGITVDGNASAVTAVLQTVL